MIKSVLIRHVTGDWIPWRQSIYYFSSSDTGAWTWWRHQMEIFSALLAICAGNSPVPGEFPAQRPVTPSFDVYFDLSLNKRLNKQSWGWWFETLWRHCNEYTTISHRFLWDTKSYSPYFNSCLNKPLFTELKEISFWRNFSRWLHRKLLFEVISDEYFIKMTVPFHWLRYNIDE